MDQDTNKTPENSGKGEAGCRVLASALVVVRHSHSLADLREGAAS